MRLKEELSSKAAHSTRLTIIHLAHKNTQPSFGHWWRGRRSHGSGGGGERSGNLACPPCDKAPGMAMPDTPSKVPQVTKRHTNLWDSMLQNETSACRHRDARIWPAVISTARHQPRTLLSHSASWAPTQRLSGFPGSPLPCPEHRSPIEILLSDVNVNIALPFAT